VLNVTTADSFDFLADEIEAAKKSGLSTSVAVKKVVTETFKAHQRIIQNGDGYAKSWPVEAKKRGLLNAKTTPDALDAVDNAQTRDLLNRYGVLSKEEFDAHLSIDYTKYAQQILLEAGTLKNLANKYIVPAAIRYQNLILEHPAEVPATIKERLKDAIAKAVAATEALREKEEKLAEILEEDKKAARYSVDSVVPAMKETRDQLDKLEDLVCHKFWPLPSYEEMLLSRHVRNCD